MSKPRMGSPTPAIGLAISRAPLRPTATDDYTRGCYPYSLSSALKKRHLQFNRKHTVSVLIFDVDRRDAGLAWERHGLPPPTWIATNRENGHAHLAYVLDTPVLRTYESTQVPVWLLELVTRAMTAALDADRSYQHFLTKNPLHSDWSVVTANKTYSLDELCDWIPDEFLEAAAVKSKFNLADALSSTGSSVPKAFDICRHLAYWHWRTVVAEIRATGRSATLEQLTFDALTDPSTGELRLRKDNLERVIRQVGQWVDEKYDERKANHLLLQRQSRRGKKSARIRRDTMTKRVSEAVQSLRLTGQPVTQRAVADLVGCTQPLISQRYKHLLSDNA